MMKGPPWFIVLEGIDGSGTTTQAAELTKYLCNHGIPTVLTSEPSNAFVGPIIHNILKAKAGWEVPYKEDAFRACMALLFSADRIDHVHRFIKPALEVGTSVVCDRYWLSTLAYQTPAHTAASFNETTVWLQALRRKCLVPNVTFFFDLNPEVALKRVQERSDKPIEIYERLPIQERVASNYRVLANRCQDSEFVLTIDASQPQDEVFKSVLNYVTRLFGSWLTPESC